MTCVWKGLIKKLNLDIRPIDLVRHIKHNNISTIDILWNGEELTEQNYRENIEWIKSIRETRINEGYSCSGCDPLLMLVAQLYEISIEHIYCKNKITYINKKNSNKIIKCKSNKNHFY